VIEVEGFGFVGGITARDVAGAKAVVAAAFYRCYAPTPRPLMALVKIEGIPVDGGGVLPSRQGPGRAGPYQVRDWRAWHRHITLAMLALAFLAAIAALQPACDQEHIPLAMPEMRRLPAVLVLARNRTIRQVLHWSQWRRRHQATARCCHYQRRSQPCAKCHWSTRGY
jgi:hypothetical protein